MSRYIGKIIPKKCIVKIKKKINVEKIINFRKITKPKEIRNIKKKSK